MSIYGSELACIFIGSPANDEKLALTSYLAFDNEYRGGRFRRNLSGDDNYLQSKHKVRNSEWREKGNIMSISCDANTENLVFSNFR